MSEADNIIEMAPGVETPPLDSYGGWRLEPGEDGPWLDVRRLDGIAPAPFDPRLPPLPAAVHDALFAPIAPDTAERAAWEGADIPPAATYALLDGAAIAMLPDRLALERLEHDCLFSGKALEDLGATAPWLVRLSPEGKLMHALIARGGRGAGLWDRHAGIFLRSRLGLPALRAHLRRFTRLSDPDGKWFFNRFWSPSVSTTLLALGNDRDLAPSVSPLFPAGRAALRMIVFSPHGHFELARRPGTEPPRVRPILTAEVKEWLRHIRRVQQFEELIAIALRHVGAQTPLPPRAAADHLRACREEFFGIGFWRRDHLVSLCVWELMLGPDFVQSYAGGAIRAIIETSEEDWQAIQRITDFLDPPPPEPTEAELRAAQIALYGEDGV